MPKVSFVSPVYNRAEFIVDSVQSMLNQDFDDFEVVIIDDCSPDDTWEKLNSIKDDRLILLRNEENMGCTASVHKAVLASSGEYIAFVDGADICKPNRLKEQAKFLDENPNVGVVGSWVELYEQRNGKTQVIKLETGDNPKEKLLKETFLWHSEVTYRRDLYDKVGGYRKPFYYSEDNDLWLRMSEHMDIAILPKVLQRIIKFDNGVTTTPEKFALARIYRDFASYCARERRAGRVDPSVEYHEMSLFLRPRSSHLANRLAGDALKQVLRQNKAVGLWIMNRALDEKWTLKTVLYSILVRIPFFYMVRAISLKVKKLIKRS